MILVIVVEGIWTKGWITKNLFHSSIPKALAMPIIVS